MVAARRLSVERAINLGGGQCDRRLQHDEIKRPVRREAFDAFASTTANRGPRLEEKRHVAA